MKSALYPILTCVVLGACSSSGGSDSGPTTPADNTPPRDDFMPLTNDDFTVTRDLVADTYTVTPTGGEPIVFEGAPAFDRGIFDTATLQDGGGSIAAAALDGGSAILFFPNSVDQSTAEVILGQAAETSIPALGGAAFTGDYAGSVFLAEGILADTSGNITLNVDFESRTLSGRVSNRTVNSFDTDDGLTSADDIVLNTVTFDANGVTAPAGGRATTDVLIFEGQRFVQSQDGTFSSILSDENAANAFGSVRIDYTLEGGGDIATEFGAFAASQE